MTAKNLAAMLEALGCAGEARLCQTWRRNFAGSPPAGAGTVEVLTCALASALSRGVAGRRVAGAAAELARALPQLCTEAVLGVGTSRPRRAEASVPATGQVGDERSRSLLAAQARAALRAIDLSAELGRRAEQLLAGAPKLRARGADTFVARLLNEDALVGSRGARKNGMSDRGLRRLFDRLAGLGAARELSGQPFASTGSDDDSRGDTDESRQKHGQRMRSEDRLFDWELDHLPPEVRWREWMNRVEAVTFAASKVSRKTLSRIVGKAAASIF